MENKQVENGNNYRKELNKCQKCDKKPKYSIDNMFTQQTFYLCGVHARKYKENPFLHKVN